MTEKEFFGEDSSYEKKGESEEINKESSDLSSLIGKNVLGWIKGSIEGKPKDLRQFGEDLAQKMNLYIAGVVLSQYSRIPKLFEALEVVEEKMLDKEELALLTDGDEISKAYNNITKEINSVINFAQKYVIQNKDLLIDNTNFFERQLFEKIKMMSIDTIRDYLAFFTIIDTKGSNLLKEIIEKYK